MTVPDRTRESSVQLAINFLENIGRDDHASTVAALYDLAEQYERELATVKESLTVAERELARVQTVVEAVFSIVDSLDFPYEGDGESWAACTQEQCAGELDRIRAALVPATDAYCETKNRVSAAKEPKP